MPGQLQDEIIRIGRVLLLVRANRVEAFMKRVQIKGVARQQETTGVRRNFGDEHRHLSSENLGQCNSQLLVPPFAT